MSNWIEWKRVNSDKIFHEMGFEETFVDTILCRTPGVCPSDVVAQFAFLDDKGKNRRIDFMIVNPDKGYLLPIELDGRVQPGGLRGGKEWDEFLERGNAIIRKFGTLLRFSNYTMFNDQDNVIRQISEVLSIQKARKIAKEKQGNVLREPESLNILYPPSAVRLAAKEAKPTSNRDSSTRRRTMKIGAALFASIILSYFIWQNGAQHNAAVQVTPVVIASAGPRAMPKATVVVPDAVIPEKPVATASIGVRDTPPPIVSIQDPNSASGNFILASQAQAYIGQYKQVCGHTAGLKEPPTGLFIAFDRPYPNEAMTAVIWRQHLNIIDRGQLTENRQVCISGMIQTYRGKPQIEIDTREQISP